MSKSVDCPCCQTKRVPTKQGTCPECGWTLRGSESVLGFPTREQQAEQEREIERCRERRRKKLREKETVPDSTRVGPEPTILQPAPSVPSLEWRAHENNKAVRSMSVKPNDVVIASGGMDHAVKVWRIGSTKEERTIRERGYPVFAIAFDPSGQVLASGDSDGTILICKPFSAAWRSIKTLSAGKYHQVHSMAFSPDGSWFCCGDDRSMIHVWDARTWMPEIEFDTHLSTVHSLGFCPGNASRLVAAGDNGSLQIWDIASHQTRPNPPAMNHSGGPVLSIGFSPGGGLLFSGGAD
ncbi:partial putative serine/threonine-protein kinase PkwA, partial [Anaerolineae bacterium]